MTMVVRCSTCERRWRQSVRTWVNGFLRPLFCSECGRELEQIIELGET